MRTMNKFVLLIILSMCLYGCSSKTVVEQPADTPAIERVLRAPTSHLGKTQTVAAEVKEDEDTQNSSTTVSIGNNITLTIPSRYTVDQVSWNGHTKLVLYSVQDNDTLDVYSASLANEVSSNEAADGMTKWFLDTFCPEKQPKSIGNAVRSGTTIQNIIKFTDDTALTYFCIKTDVVAIEHKVDSPILSTLTNSILSGSSDTSQQPQRAETLPSTYTALQGAHYYSLKSVVSGNSTCILFPLTSERTTIQIFDSKSSLLYDAYLQSNSMYYANNVKLKLDPSYIVYTSKNLAISPIEVKSETSDNSE